MDAIKFVKEYLRMCSQPWDCEDCPLNKTGFCSAPAKKRSQEEAEKIVQLVEEWSIANPRKTKQDVFLEQYPEAKIENDGCLGICPYLVSASHRDKHGLCAIYGKDCIECRHEFWPQEVK